MEYITIIGIDKISMFKELDNEIKINLSFMLITEIACELNDNNYGNFHEDITNMIKYE